MGPKRNVAKVANKKKIDLTPYGFQGKGVLVPGLFPINMYDYTVEKDPDEEKKRALESVLNPPINVVKDPNEERKKALESVFKLPSTSLSTLLPPETDVEKTTVKEMIDLTPSVLSKKQNDPFTKDREPGSGPLDIEEEKEEAKQRLDFDDDDADFELMDIEEEEKPLGGKRRHRKMKTKKASRKSKRGKKHSSSHKTKSKRRRTFVRRR